MTRFTFIRHAESVANAGGITQPHHAIPLSDRGRSQARELAETIDIEPRTVLVSGFIRTAQTAEPLCSRLGLLPNIEPLLNEFSVIDPALIDGMTGPQRKPFVKAYWDDPDPNRRLGEMADTFAEFEARVVSFLARMSDLPDGTVIFGHGIWFGLLLWRLRGRTAGSVADMRAFRQFQLALPMPNCATFSLVGNKSHWTATARTVSIGA